MSINYAILAKIVDYLRGDKETIKTILCFNPDIFYDYKIIRQDNQVIRIKNQTIYQYKYTLVLPFLYFDYNGWNKRSYCIPTAKDIDFIISFRPDKESVIDKQILDFLNDNNDFNDLSLLLLIMTLPNWCIGVYKENKGENKN